MDESKTRGIGPWTWNGIVPKRNTHVGCICLKNHRDIAGQLTMDVVMPGWKARKFFPRVANQFLKTILTLFAIQTSPNCKQGA